MKYKFEQFNIELDSPTISIPLEDVTQNDFNKEFSCKVILEVNGAKYIHFLHSLPYVGILTESEVNDVVMNKLKEFEV